MIGFERRGRVGILRMEHGKASALDLEFCNALGSRFRGLAADPAAAFVLTGTGGIFSAGVDLLRLRDGGEAYVRAFVAALEPLFAAQVRAPKPIVAAVNGHAIAGGCILALGCDRRLMAEGKGTMGVAELRVGVPFPPIALEIVRAAAAPAVFRSLVLTGEPRSAADALRDGLVDALCPPDSLLDRAVEEAERLAAIPPVSFAIAKRQAFEGVLRALGDAPVRSDEVRAAWIDPSVRDAVAAFVRKTLGR
ncbi:MAG TPA: enoyl-CoA hydratase/isomerase family protein [Planctomycetota bacterium]|nr:enoyl-CoA hydratase/isomerase family protein [Planctomycetota bacterium]